MRKFLLLILAALQASAGLAGAAESDAFRRFVAIWPGDYDNLAQVRTQADRPASERNTPTVLHIRRADLPAFGKETVYAEWLDANDPTKVLRQRIYAFSAEPDGKRFRLGLHIFPTDKPAFTARTAGAWRDPARLAGVTPADMAGLKGCDVLFAAAGKGFTGAMEKGTCAFDAPDGTPIYSWSQMRISAATFSYLDGWFRRDGSVYRRLSPDWYVFRKGAP
jgi:hypothetical protein